MVNFNKLKENIFSNRNFVPEELKEIKNLNKLLDWEKARHIVYMTIVLRKRIVIISDYDADGVTSATVLKKAFRIYLNYGVHVLINERRFQNGVNDTMVKRLFKLHEDSPVGLIITSDHGSADEERYKKIREKGIEIVVTDHHLIPKENFPISANAFVNPQRDNDRFYKGVSGCQMAYFLMLGVYEKYCSDNRIDFNLMPKLLPYVGISVITDVMPLNLSINKFIYDYGMQRLNARESGVTRAMFNRLNLGSQVEERDIGFEIGPVINCGNRMGVAYKSFEFLSYLENIVFKDDKAIEKIDGMIELNQTRKRMQNHFLRIATEQVSNKLNKGKNQILILLKDADGLAGVIAGNIGERFNKPTIVLSFNEDGLGVGSGRAILDEYDLKKGLDYINERLPLVKYGGHKPAAGVTVKKEDVFIFSNLFEESLIDQNIRDSKEKDLVVDMEIKNEDINLILYYSIRKYAPYGNKWEEPLFKSIFRVRNILFVGKEKQHVILRLYKDNKKIIEGFMPNGKEKVKNIHKGDKVVALYSLYLKKYRRNTSLSLTIKKVDKIDKPFNPHEVFEKTKHENFKHSTKLEETEIRTRKKFHTSYYSNIPNIPEDYFLVAISIGLDKKLRSVVDYWDKEVAPSWKILREHKNNSFPGNKEERYIKRYTSEVLEKVNWRNKIEEWSKASGDSENIVLLCYEKPEDFCHRHLLADHVMKYTKIKVNELDLNKGDK